jgi:putative endonuclease
MLEAPTPIPHVFYTYILQCADESLYTGWTTDVAKRLKAHNSGKGSRYTRGRLPARLVRSWEFATKHAAMSWEYKLKKMPRNKKLSTRPDEATSEVTAAL